MATLEAWNGRVATQTDANSPLDAPLLDGFRKDLDHLRQTVYGNNEGAGTYFTPVWGHRHTGSDSHVIGAPAVQSSGSQVIAASATWTPSVGTYQMVMVAAVGVAIELFISSSWRGYTGNGIREGGWSGIFDGTNMRLREFSATGATLWYQKFN